MTWCPWLSVRVQKSDPYRRYRRPFMTKFRFLEKLLRWELGKKLEFWNVHEFSRPGCSRPRPSLPYPLSTESSTYSGRYYGYYQVQKRSHKLNIYKITKKPKTKIKTGSRARSANKNRIWSCENDTSPRIYSG